MRKSIALVLVMMLLLSGWALMPTPVIADDEDPDAEGKIFGPWNITTTKSYSNRTIEVTGNITVRSGGELILDNVTLIMNSSSAEEYFLVVQGGGNLEVVNGSKVMNNITQDSPYYIIVEGDAGATITDSEILRMGNQSFGQDFTFNYSRVGLLVQSGAVTIKNNHIADGYAGCICTKLGFLPIVPTIQDNVFENNTFGLGVSMGCSPILGGNSYIDNEVGVGDFLKLLSSLNIHDETFDGNIIGIGAYTATISITDSVIVNSTAIGIAGFGGSIINGDNVVLKDNANATYMDATTFTLLGSDVSTSDDWDFFVDNGSTVEVVDTVLDRKDGIKVNDTGSSFNNSYHLDVNVQYQLGGPVIGALVNMTTLLGEQVVGTATDTNGDTPTLLVAEISNNGTDVIYNTPHGITAEKGAHWNETTVNLTEPMAIVLMVYERDLVAPDLTITSPEDGAHLPTGVVDVQGTAGDNDVVELVEVTGDGVNWTNATGTASWSAQIAFPGDGAFDICARAWDASGNNVTECIGIVVDTVPPELNVTDPVEGEYFNYSQLFVRGTTTGDLLTVNGEDVTVFNGTFSHAITLALEGANDIVVVASDLAGNENATTVTVYKDLIPPSISVLSPQPGSTIEHLDIVVAGNVTDSQGVVSLKARHHMVSGWTEADINFTDMDHKAGAFTVDLTMVEGKNIIHLMATDRAGNNGTYEFNLTVDLPDTVPPKVEITSPAQGDRITGLDILVEGTASDNEELVNVEVSTDNATWASTSTSNDWATWRINVTLVEGNNTIYARATDLDGNEALTDIEVTAAEPFVDDVPPTVTVTSHTHNQVMHRKKVTLSGTVSDNDKVRSVYVSLTGAGSDATWVLADVDEAGGTWSLDVTLEDGWNEIAVRATDESLNNETVIVALKYEKKVEEGFNYAYLFILVVIFIILAVVYMATLPGRQRARMAGDERLPDDEEEEGRGEEE
jgi:hypothetical protein